MGIRLINYQDASTADSLYTASDKINDLMTWALARFSFKTIQVSGQPDVAADSTDDTITLVAGPYITIATDATNKTVTITADESGLDTTSFVLSKLSEVYSTCYQAYDNPLFTDATFVGDIRMQGTVFYLNSDYAGGDEDSFFYFNQTAYLQWDDGFNIFRFSAPLFVTGAIQAVNSAIQAGTDLHAFGSVYVNQDYSSGDEDAIIFFNAATENITFNYGTDQFTFSKGIYSGAAITALTNLAAGGNIYVNADYVSGDEDAVIYFNSATETLTWNYGNSRFELSDDFYINGDLRADGTANFEAWGQHYHPELKTDSTAFTLTKLGEVYTAIADNATDSTSFVVDKLAEIYTAIADNAVDSTSFVVDKLAEIYTAIADNATDSTAFVLTKLGEVYSDVTANTAAIAANAVDSTNFVLTKATEIYDEGVFNFKRFHDTITLDTGDEETDVGLTPAAVIISAAIRVSTEITGLDSANHHIQLGINGSATRYIDVAQGNGQTSIDVNKKGCFTFDPAKGTEENALVLTVAGGADNIPDAGAVEVEVIYLAARDLPDV